MSAAVSAGAGRPLGIYTKSLHAGGAAKTKSPAATAGRYALQRTAQGLLWQKGVEWKEQHRTCWCCRSLKRESGSVGVFRNADGSGSSLTGLNRCGEIWTCPVCAARICEERRRELSAGMTAHVGNGGAAYLFTLTFPHEADHDLGEMLERFANVRQRMQNSRTWKRLMQQAGCVGRVSALELTISQENGWHPHVHMLVFAKAGGLGEGAPINEHGDLDSPEIAELRLQWVNLLLKVGFGDRSKVTDMMKHSFNVRGGTKAAEYIAKYGRDERWGASSEMTASYQKTGAAGERQGLMHFTPFQLLTWAGNGDAWAACRFREYAKHIAGKRAITWTPGLKKALGVDSDRTDDEIAADDSRLPEQIEVGELTTEQFQTVLRRARLPDFMRYVADATCQADIDDYVNAIASIAPTNSGAVVIRGAFAGRYAIN
ncbi:protein rep [Rhodocyclus gracilis]|uniref:Replication protein n=1 Tax=Rhodocyclus tenuis TaxID=1066 RepID=A0A6L5JTW9_RHOTE|nr:protein rep [Rhodocyclus gracilis]MQY50843.1 hypothetical protein [Rhodocyclus gracilis]